jgi:hypothetical protein
MASFEMLYGYRYRTPLFWNETVEWKVFGPNILQESERQVDMVEENLRIAQSRQKCYADHRRRSLTLKFWERLHETLDTQLCFSFSYHPQTDGQTERVNQILEDMLRACALQYERSWDKSLSYVEFSYNNSYQESLKMALFELLYGRRCRTP